MRSSRSGAGAEERVAILAKGIDMAKESNAPVQPPLHAAMLGEFLGTALLVVWEMASLPGSCCWAASPTT